MDYVLVTPARNEEKSLPQLAKCLINQTIAPKAWIIVDDRSNDRTPEIAKKLSQDNPWIYYKRLNEGSINNFTIDDFEIHFAIAVKAGFDYALEVCQENNIPYAYIGKIDADMLVPLDHFERLMEKFKSEPKLGDTSGYAGTGHPIQTKIVYGGLYLLRRECFEQIGNIPVEYDIDNVIQIKAIIRGWEVCTFPDIRFVLTRPPTFWNAKRQGFKAYVLNYPPQALVWFLLRMLLTRKPHHILAFIHGYLDALIKRENKVADEEVKYYYKVIYPRILRDALSSWVKKKLFERTS